MLKDFFLPSKRNSYSKDEIDILRLIRSENVGPKTFYSLVNLFGSVESALARAPELSLKGGRSKPIKICTLGEVEKELEDLDNSDAKLLTYNSINYPKILTNIPDFPPVLTYKGDVSLLKKKSIGIVGSRNASINGMAFSAKIAKELVEQDFAITSGLARGIDTAAHQASLGSTIAVIAGGIDYIYPPENTKLYQSLASGSGLIIAEGIVKSRPLAQHFPQRNRLISGLSLGVLIVEANLRSGSLITARCALEQNREVFAVPGFPLDPRCQGTNKLLKEGAILVESVEDILDNIKQFDTDNVGFKEEIDKDDYRKLNLNYERDINDQMRQKVINLLSSSPTSLELIIEELNLPVQIVLFIVLELELAGRISRLPGNKLSLIY